MPIETSPDGPTTTPDPGQGVAPPTTQQVPERPVSPLFQPQPPTLSPGQAPAAGPPTTQAQGQPPPTGQSTDDDPDDEDEPIRSRKDVDRLIRKRDAQKAEIETLKRQLAEHSRAGRRAAIEAQILDGVHPDHHEDVRGRILLLAERGELNLYSEDADAATTARDKLIKNHPAFYKSEEGQATVGQPGDRRPRSYAGVRSIRDIPAEEFEKMSDDDFRSISRGGAGGVTAVGPVIKRPR